MERHLVLEENKVRVLKDDTKHLKKLENSLKEGVSTAQFEIEKLREAVTAILIRCDFDDKTVFDTV